MSCLLITYDLSNPGQKYTKVFDVIKAYPYAKLSESSYAIKTQESPSQIYNRLSSHLDSNDQIYIIAVNEPHMGFGPQSVNQWLNKNL